MIHKNKIYEFVQAVTPPIIFNAFRKSGLYGMVKKPFRHVGSIEPKWQTIEAGILKGRKLLLADNKDWKKEMLEGTYDGFFFDYLQKLDLTGKTIIDVGSHIGFHALCFAVMTGDRGHVLTFEPNPFNITRIETILSENKDLAKRIELFKCALSEKDGEEDFLFSDYVDEGMSSGSFIDSADPIANKEAYETQTGFKRMKVKTMRLDSIDSIAKGKLKPDILKIDVEGAESLVLLGAEKTIVKYHPVVLLEIHSIYNMYAVTQFFSKIGYETELLKREKDGRCFLAAHIKY